MESFGQADNARAGVTEGTGLGLPLVKAMIELHGGTLELDKRGRRRHDGHDPLPAGAQRRGPEGA